jgi:uncharacterized protein YgfB (UPF0149 family)
MIQADYVDIQRLLSEERSLTDAAEAHGTLAGCLCSAAEGFRFEEWLHEILPEGRAQPAAAATLRELFSRTADTLRAADMEFELLLPGDAQPIDARAAALAQWCQGFLYGLGSGAAQDVASLPGDVGEIVRDLTEISRADVDVAESMESNESAYAELVEFVRVSVQVVFEELEPLRDRPSSPGGSLH